MKDYSSLQNGSDIRGVAVKTDGGREPDMTENACSCLAAAFALWLSEKTGKESPAVAVGRDCRISGEALLSSAAKSMKGLGCKVQGCGLATTPAMFMSTVLGDGPADGAIMFTASHLPFDRNGMKFFTRDGGLDSKDIKKILEIAGEGRELPKAAGGEALNRDIMSVYSAHLRSVICQGLGLCEAEKPLTGLHIAVDAGNGCGGFYVRDVLEPLGADCSGSQFLDPDGYFPNHAPNPEDAAAMESISQAVKSSGADLGLIFDTDVDRAAAVGSDGREIARNRIVALAAYIASKGHPGTTVVTDSITSTELRDYLEDTLGLRHCRYRRGYKNVINKGLELNSQGVDCQLAIETSGHAAMKENYFLDDGAYLATKIVIEAALLKRKGKHIEDLIAQLKDPLEAREVRFKVLAEDFGTYAQSVLGYIEKEAPKVGGWSLELPNYEGVRVNVPGGWFLIRKSLHDPVMPLNIESDNEGGVAETLAKLKELLSAFDKLQ